MTGRVRPQRVQLRRTKGWTKPAGAVFVARPSKWGNPFKAGQILDIDEVVGRRTGELITEFVDVVPIDAAAAVALYRCNVLATYGADEIRRELAGRDLACWCPHGQPCHADVLLEVANCPAGREDAG